MSKGVKKIKFVEGKAFTRLSVPNIKLVIPPNEYSWFVVGEWEAGTTDADKKKNVTWMRQDHNRKTILNQITIPYNQKYGFKLPNNLCGSYTYYIEASISGKTSTNQTGLFVGGHCATKIVKTFWTTKQNSLNEIENHTFSFGEVIFLQFNTEGLNGDKVTVEIYNKQLFGDKLIHTYTKVQVIDGEVNVKIPNSYLWKGQLWFTLGVEEFYAKIKNPATGKYITDSSKESSKIFKIKDKIVTNSVEKPTNIVPLKIGKVNVNAERFEPCKFDSIIIKEKEKKDGKDVESKIVVFEKGKRLKNVKHPDEDIVKSVLFEFDSVIIHPEGQKVLNNVLQFLLEHQHSSISLSGYACVIGKQNYNLPLSKRRADAVKKFLEDGKLDKTRIVSVGNGEAQYNNGALKVQTNDNKNGEDNLKNKDEKTNTHARRVDIAFKFYGHDAQSITYETIAPSVSTKKDLEIEITGHDIKSCFRDKLKHKKETRVIDIGQMEDKSDVSATFTTPKFNYKVYSPLSRYNPSGAIGFDTESIKIMQYIWPASTSPNLFYFHTHSCRYFSKNENATIVVKAYPDIKWRFAFFVNLSNELNIKWQKLSDAQHKELRSKSLKLANEEKGAYSDVDFGVELKAQFDKQLDGSYFSNPELTLKYKDKIKQLFSVISSIKKISQGITAQTKGGISKGIGRKLPFQVKLNSPALYFGAEWEADFNEIHSEIGTKIKLFIEAKPLFELALVIDLLSLVIQAGVAVVTGGAGNVLALEIYNKVRTWAEEGLKTDNVEVTFKMYIDLEIKGTVSGSIDGTFSTVTDGKEVNFSLESNVSLELKAGLELKGMYLVIGTSKKPELEGHAEGNLSASAKMGLTSGHALKYDLNVGVFYQPTLKVDPCIGQVVLMVKVGFTYKKVSSDWKPINYNNQRTFYEGFDIMKKLSEITGRDSKILLWEKKKKIN